MINLLYQRSALAMSSTLERREFIENVIDSDTQAKLINQIRSTEDEKKQGKLKVKLAGAKFNARPTQEAIVKAKEAAKVSKRRPAYKRSKDEEELTRWFQFDADHLQENYGITAEELNKRFFDEALPALGWAKEARVGMTFRSSRLGWKAIILGTPGSTIVEDSLKLAEALGIKADEKVMNQSQLCFLPSSKLGDVLYYNPDLLWGEDKDFEYGVGEELKPSKQKAADVVRRQEVDVVAGGPLCQALSSDGSVLAKTLPATFKGAKWEDIVDAFIQLKWHSRPAEGERNAKLFELAMIIAHIADNRPAWVYQILADEAKEWGLDDKEILATINSACKEAIKTQTSKLLDKAVMIAQQRNGVAAANDMAPQLPPDEQLHPLLRMFTSRVMSYQREAVATMILPWFGAYPHNLLIRNVDNSISECALIACCIGSSSVGKSIVDRLYKIVCAALIKKTKESEALQQDWNDANESTGSNKDKRKRLNNLVFPEIKANATAAFVRWALWLNEKENNTSAIIHTNEAENLYNLVNDGNLQICSFIKMLFDRDIFGAQRFTSGASNYSAPARVFITMCCTLEKFLQVFRKAIIDGTAGRIDVPLMVKPQGWDEEFRYGDFDKAFRDELKPYIDNLANYTPQYDEDGEPMPLFVQNAYDLHKEIGSYIKDYVSNYDDGEAYESFAYRTNEMSYRKCILLYIANGMKWDPSFDEYYRWSFHYSMYSKMKVMGEEALSQLKSTELAVRGNRKSPLASLPTTFTREQAQEVCRELGTIKTVAATLAQWKNRELITTDDGETFTKTSKGLMVKNY